MLHPTDRVTYQTAPTLGCDPELFFEKGGNIIGSEKVLADTGMVADYHRPGGGIYKGNKIVTDGVQVELNPTPISCRALLAGEIAASFRALRDHLATMQGVAVSFRSVVEVNKQELDALSERSKLLGCAPSRNTYDKEATISVDLATFRTRSAGGHIHLGLNTGGSLFKARERLVPILDILLGNTSVLIDRDPQAAERRKTYGRAGEHRLPAHGLEYRTLSNFWLRSYQLMSFVMGMARLSTNVLYQTLEGRQYYSEPSSFNYLTTQSKWDAEAALLKSVDLEAVRRAINENDLTLAKQNWQGVKQFLSDHVTLMDSGLDEKKVDSFEYFTRMIEEKGITHWFPEDPMTHWCAIQDGHGVGWEAFLNNQVTQQMMASKPRLVVR